MARSVDDLARLYAVLCGEDDFVTTSTISAGTLTAAVAATWRTGHTETDQRFDEVIASLKSVLGAVVSRDVAVPSEEVGNDELTVLLAETFDDLTAYLTARGGTPATLAEVVAFERAHAETELAYFGHELFERALTTGGRSGDGYLQARTRNLQWATTTCLEPALEGVDVLLAPTYGPAWKQDLHIGEHGVAAPTTCAPAIAGWPIATVPMGLVRGLPVGLGIIGRPGSEATIVGVARAIEATLDLASDPTYRPSFAAPRRG
jgi:amidase